MICLCFSFFSMTHTLVGHSHPRSRIGSSGPRIFHAFDCISGDSPGKLLSMLPPGCTVFVYGRLAGKLVPWQQGSTRLGEPGRSNLPGVPGPNQMVEYVAYFMVD